MPTITDDDRLLEALSRLKVVAPTQDAQSEILREVEEEAIRRLSIWKGGVEPMPFDVYCEYIDGSALTPRQYKVFSEAGLMSAYSWISPDRTINEIVLEWGKGAGKGYTSAKACSYLAYVVQCLAVDPASFITSKHVTPLAKGTKLDIVNVAPNEDLARDVFFRYLKQFLAHALFAPYRPHILQESVVFCSDEEWEAAKKAGRDPLYLLGIFSKNSRSSGLDGFNLLLWFMDEADAFLSTEKKCNASDIHDIFRSSAGTRMGNCWTGIVASYPRLEAGFMESLYERAKKNMAALGPKASYYADKAATWEVRPGVDREHVASIEEDYQNDPTAARAKYECVPMSAEDAFFEFPEKVDAAVDPTREPAAIVAIVDKATMLRNGNEEYFVSTELSDIRPVPGYQYFLAGDAGRDKDAYALCLMHIDAQSDAALWICPVCGRDPAARQAGRYVLQERPSFVEVTDVSETPECGLCGALAGHRRINALGVGSYWTSGWWKVSGGDESLIMDSAGNKYNVPHIYEDLLIQLKPRRATRPGEKNMPVDLPGVQTLCRQLIEGFGVEIARFDPWQTSQMTQGLRDITGADVDEIGFSNPEQYKRARLVKSLLYAGAITLLPNTARDREWKRLMRVGAGKIDHPEHESKDLFDAEAIAIWLAATSRCGQLSLTWA